MADWQSGSTSGSEGAGSEPPSERWGGDDLLASVALVIPVGCLVVLAGAAIAGLSFGNGEDSDAWKAKVKVAGLAATFIGGGSAAVIGIAAALLAAVVFGRLAHAGPAVGTAVLLAAAWLIVVTVLNTIVDVTYIGDVGDRAGDTGYVVGLLVSDVGALAVLGATAVIGGRSLKA